MGARRGMCVVAVLAFALASATPGASADEPSTLAFSQEAVTVARSAGGATLTVLRSGDSSQAAGATVTGSEGFEGHVTIEAGAGSGTISVPLPERGSIAPGGFVTFTLSDPSAGSEVGFPDAVQMTIYEDEPDPEPMPTRNRAPDTTIGRSRAGILAGQATDAEGRLVRVEVSVLKREGRACRSVKASGRLARRGACRASYRLIADGTRRWAFRPGRRLPAGRYVVWARAVDAAGVADPSPSKRAFVVR
ncbi:MAG TPA: hypothetical protein VFT50_03735 [Baekduia sp.]|nr:hypothetical protein [Baekduia sp.]